MNCRCFFLLGIVLLLGSCIAILVLLLHESDQKELIAQKLMDANNLKDDCNYQLKGLQTANNFLEDQLATEKKAHNETRVTLESKLEKEKNRYEKSINDLQSTYDAFRNETLAKEKEYVGKITELQRMFTELQDKLKQAEDMVQKSEQRLGQEGNELDKEKHKINEYMQKLMALGGKNDETTIPYIEAVTESSTKDNMV